MACQMVVCLVSYQTELACSQGRGQLAAMKQSFRIFAHPARRAFGPKAAVARLRHWITFELVRGCGVWVQSTHVNLRHTHTHSS